MPGQVMENLDKGEMAFDDLNGEGCLNEASWGYLLPDRAVLVA